MTALDTNVIIALALGAEKGAERALRAVEHAAERGSLVVCPVVYAELCAWPGRSVKDVRAALDAARISVDTELPFEIWTAAGAAFRDYVERRRNSAGGEARRILADFIIGAHALHAGRLVTADARFYRRAFPSLSVFEI